MTGVHGELDLASICSALIVGVLVYSCQSSPRDLDGQGSTQPRTKNSRETRIVTSDVPTLWKHHGIVADVIVSLIQCENLQQDSEQPLSSPLQMIFHELTYMNC
jgi:hypothetical protein